MTITTTSTHSTMGLTAFGNAPATGLASATHTTPKLLALRTAAEHCLALARRPLGPELHPEVARRLHTLFVRIAACEAGGHTRAEIGALVWPVRELVSESPLFRRLQAWPGGRTMDHATAALLCEERSALAEHTLGGLLDTYLLRSPLAQQLRNRVARQGELLLAMLLERGASARVLVLGCGPATEVAAVSECVRFAPGQVTLHDVDPAAVAHATRRLGRTAAACRFVSGDALATAASLAESGPYDLVLLGSTLDGLSDRHAAALLQVVHGRLLAPQGRCLVTVTADGNPFRPCLEYLTEWAPVGRSESELARLCGASGAPAGAVRVTRDGTGLALLAELSKAPGARAAA